MPKQTPKWKDFEVLIAKIQSQAAPDAVVRHNHRVVGESGRRRQLDVTISQNIGIHPVFIVIECKHSTRPITIGTVEGFVTKLADVRASKGVMISTSGFDEGAKAVAAKNQISLLVYREAFKMDWQKMFAEGAWLRLILPFASNVVASVTFVDQSPLQISFETMLFGAQREPLFPVQQILDQQVSQIRVIGTFGGRLQQRE
jgi:Restriction endonuclease